MTRKRLKPAEGRAVPDLERGDLLPADGRDVELSDYWLRRLADGDVVEAAEAVEVAAAPKGGK